MFHLLEFFLILWMLLKLFIIYTKVTLSSISSASCFNLIIPGIYSSPTATLSPTPRPPNPCRLSAPNILPILQGVIVNSQQYWNNLSSPENNPRDLHFTHQDLIVQHYLVDLSSPNILPFLNPELQGAIEAVLALLWFLLLLFIKCSISGSAPAAMWMIILIDCANSGKVMV